jgi:hypothetical protein
MKRIYQWKKRLKNLSNKRERNVNRYIIPIEQQMSDLRDKIREVEPEYNDF